MIAPELQQKANDFLGMLAEMAATGTVSVRATPSFGGTPEWTVSHIDRRYGRYVQTGEAHSPDAFVALSDLHRTWRAAR